MGLSTGYAKHRQRRTPLSYGYIPLNAAFAIADVVDGAKSAFALCVNSNSIGIADLAAPAWAA